MPYEIVKSVAGGKEGYRVRESKDKHKPPYYLSKKALPLETAKKQRTAVILSEMGKSKPKKKAVNKKNKK